MSLKATGTPVSGPALPWARNSSARRAWPSAWSSSTVMKALSSPFRRRTRSRHRRVSSTEETFLAASAAESSARVEFSTLFHHPGHEVEPVLDRRCDRLISRTLILFARFVAPQPLHYVERVRHRL